MMPNTIITIRPDGSSEIVGMEQTDQCHKLSELGKAAGKVTSDQDKEHTPVFHSVSQKN